MIGLGVVLVIAGFLITNEAYKSISGLCFGIGAGLIGMNLANVYMERYYQQHPQVKRQSDIDARDERSVLINTRAKAKAFDWMVKLFIAIPFVLILFNSPLWQILAVVGIYLFAFGLQIYFTIQFNKEM
jgi:hypothetical protein